MLSQRWLINLALILIIAGLVIAAILLEQSDEDPTGQRISPLTTDQVNRIEVDYAGARILLVRTAADWTIESPVSWPAQTGNVERLLGILNSQSPSLANTTDVDLAALGFDTPAARLRFNETEWQFGATNNIGERRYLMTDDRLYLLPDLHLAFIAQGLPGLVQRQLVPKPFAIRSINLPGYRIQLDANGDWQSDPTVLADTGAVQQLVDTWQKTQASRIQPFKLRGAISEVIDVELKNGRKLEFLLMATEPELILANPAIELQYHFPRDQAESFLDPRVNEVNG